MIKKVVKKKNKEEDESEDEDENRNVKRRQRDSDSIDDINKPNYDEDDDHLSQKPEYIEKSTKNKSIKQKKTRQKSVIDDNNNNKSIKKNEDKRKEEVNNSFKRSQKGSVSTEINRPNYDGDDDALFFSV